MKLNDEPDVAFKAMLEDAEVDVPIYVIGEMPTSSLPDAFIEIRQNGPISSTASQLGSGKCVLLVAITVKLLSKGGTNKKKENLILAKFQDLFDPAVSSSGFVFSLDKKNLVFTGKDLISGYSTKMLNIITTL